MGTNYYWIDTPCEHCGRSDVFHVGKSGRSWRAYRPPNMPFDFPVTSIADWRRVFTERKGWLEDEYRVRIDDPIAWLDEQRPLTGRGRDEVLKWWGDRDMWDENGYYFYDGEFC